MPSTPTEHGQATPASVTRLARVGDDGCRYRRPVHWSASVINVLVLLVTQLLTLHARRFTTFIGTRHESTMATNVVLVVVVWGCCYQETDTSLSPQVSSAVHQGSAVFYWNSPNVFPYKRTEYN